MKLGFQVVIAKTFVVHVTLLLCLHLQPSTSVIIYVSPSPPCLVQSQPYLSLDQLASNTSWVESITTLIFLPGIHRLSNDLNLSISNIRYLSLIPEGESQNLIACQGNTSFVFQNVSHVQVSGLKLLGCKCSVESVKQLTVENSTFQGQNDSGTALKINATNANITKSSFVFNRIGSCDQIYFVDVNKSIYILAGGAIYASGGFVTINGSRFEGNVAEIGGAIFSYGCNMTIFDTSFIDNHVIVANTEVKEMLCNKHGYRVITRESALYQIFSNFIIVASKIVYSANGGAIILFGSNLLVTIDTCVFDNNTSSNGDGGALVNMNGGCLVQIYNSKFYNGYAGGSGGALCTYSNNNVIFVNCTVYNNHAYNAGVVHARGSNVTIKSSTFRDNKANGYGGVILLMQKGHVKLCSSQFIDNQAENGGVLYALNSDIDIEGNNTFLTSKVEKFGGAVYSSQSVVKVSGSCIFRGNEANKGGAIYADKSTVLHIYNKITITSNVASTSGGGLYLYHSMLNCHEGSNMTVLGNRANHLGGGAYVANSYITIYYNRSSQVGSSVQLNFVNNRAKWGGGICLQSSAQL